MGFINKVSNYFSGKPEKQDEVNKANIINLPFGTKEQTLVEAGFLERLRQGSDEHKDSDAARAQTFVHQANTTGAFEARAVQYNIEHPRNNLEVSKDIKDVIGAADESFSGDNYSFAAKLTQSIIDEQNKFSGCISEIAEGLDDLFQGKTRIESADKTYSKNLVKINEYADKLLSIKDAIGNFRSHVEKVNSLDAQLNITAKLDELDKDIDNFAKERTIESIVAGNRAKRNPIIQFLVDFTRLLKAIFTLNPDAIVTISKYGKVLDLSQRQSQKTSEAKKAEAERADTAAQIAQAAKLAEAEKAEQAALVAKKAEAERAEQAALAKKAEEAINAQVNVIDSLKSSLETKRVEKEKAINIIREANISILNPNTTDRIKKIKRNWIDTQREALKTLTEEILKAERKLFKEENNLRKLNGDREIDDTVRIQNERDTLAKRAGHYSFSEVMDLIYVDLNKNKEEDVAFALRKLETKAGLIEAGYSEKEIRKALDELDDGRKIGLGLPTLASQKQAVREASERIDSESTSGGVDITKAIDDIQSLYDELNELP